MNTKNAFSTLLTVLITAVAVGVLTGVISYSYAVSKKDLEIEGLKERLSQVKEQASDKVTDWKTYTHSLKAFTISFKYPGDWIVDNEWPTSYFKIYKTFDDENNNYIMIDFVGGSGDTSMYGNKISESTKTVDGVNLYIGEYDKAKGTGHGGYPMTDYFDLSVYYNNANKKTDMVSVYDKVITTLQITSSNNSDKSSTNLKSEILMSLPEDNDPSTRNSAVSFNVPSDWLRKNEKFYNAGSSVEYYTNGSGMTKMMTAYTQGVPADFGTSKQGITTQKTTVNNYSVYKWTEKDGAVTYSFEAKNGEFAYKFTFDKSIDSKIIDQVINSVSY